MKITIENGSGIYSIELKGEHEYKSDKDEIFVIYHQIFKPLLYTLGFHRETIEEFFEDK